MQLGHFHLMDPCSYQLRFCRVGLFLYNFGLLLLVTDMIGLFKAVGGARVPFLSTRQAAYKKGGVGGRGAVLLCSLISWCFGVGFCNRNTGISLTDQYFIYIGSIPCTVQVISKKKLFNRGSGNLT